MLIFLGAETMFFAGLLGAFIVYRVANETWPPMSMPRLPVEVTGINTLILLYSAATMWRDTPSSLPRPAHGARGPAPSSAAPGRDLGDAPAHESAQCLGFCLLP